MLLCKPPPSLLHAACGTPKHPAFTFSATVPLPVAGANAGAGGGEGAVPAVDGGVASPVKNNAVHVVPPQPANDLAGLLDAFSVSTEGRCVCSTRCS